MIAASASAVRVDLAVQVGEVDVAVGVAGDHDHPHAGHHRAGRVGAVRAGRDQADVAAGVAVGAVVGADGQQAGQLALRAGVGLHADRVVAGDLGQPRLQLRRSARRSPAACSAGANGCMSANSGQVTGSISVVALSFIVHEPSGIMPAVQRVVLVGQAAQVAQHRGLGAVRVEDRVGQELAGAAQPGRARPIGVAAGRSSGSRHDAERRPDRRAGARRWSSRRRRR